ncbi:MAG: YitT family protein [Candidatus Limiplasma sp.]|nr:YitT family protein [Candidatus Limiplasma sp.]
MKKIWKQLPVVVLAIAIMSLSINFFLAPHQVAAGGVNGIGILLEGVTGINRSWTVLGLNAAMLVLAFIFLGRKVFGNTLFGSLLLPLALAVVPDRMLVQDRFFSVVIGSALFAVAVVMLYRNEASSGGTTIPPLIMKKYLGINTSLGLLATDMVVVTFNIFVFGIESFLFGVTSLIITAMVMTYLETGIRRKKAVMITSERSIETIRAALAQHAHGKMLLMDATHGRTGLEHAVLVALVEDQDYPALLKTVDACDESALVIAYNVAEVHGIEQQTYLQRLRRNAQNRPLQIETGRNAA